MTTQKMPALSPLSNGANQSPGSLSLNLAPILQRLGKAKESHPIIWSNDVKAALLSAYQAKTLVLIVVADPTECDSILFEYLTSTDELVCNYLNERFRCVCLNAKDRADGAKLVADFNITKFPTSVLVEPQSGQVRLIRGYLSGRSYVGALQSGVKRLLNGH